jgi:alpha-1,3-fucosyltransferase
LFILDEIVMTIIKQKSKTAAWFVSNCFSNNEREKLAKRLEEFIDVDVYGACGPLTCQTASDKCDEVLDTDYKFYFAFENNLSTDYVTEKTFRTMQRYIIPVIFSGAKLSLFLPPKSYIDADSFATVEDLAKHLKFLSQNPNEYVKYFWWKKYYRIEPEIDLNSYEVCRICEKINDPELLIKQKIYVDVQDWSYNAMKERKIVF